MIYWEPLLYFLTFDVIRRRPAIKSIRQVELGQVNVKALGEKKG